jgi:hypothetical protein
MSIPLDMANTPDDVGDFLIRVIRLKIEDLEGEIIGRNKQLSELRMMGEVDPKNETLSGSVAAIEKIIKARLKSKKMFRGVLMKLQQHGNKFFKFENTDTEE